jgi:acyl-CoA thioester hydrolase
MSIDLLSGYPVVIEQAVQWAEMDSFQHVNNIVYFRYFENARIAYLERIGWWGEVPQTGIGPIVASILARFRRPLTYPDTVRIGARVTEVGEDRLTMEHLIVSQARSEIATEGSSIVVCYDYRALRKTPIPDHLRRRIEELEGRK